MRYLTFAMKVKSILAAFAVAIFGGVSIAMAQSATDAKTEKSAATAAEGKTVKAFIVSTKGGG